MRRRCAVRLIVVEPFSGDPNVPRARAPDFGEALTRERPLRDRRELPSCRPEIPLPIGGSCSAFHSIGTFQALKKVPRFAISPFPQQHLSKAELRLARCGVALQNLPIQLFGGREVFLPRKALGLLEDLCSPQNDTPYERHAGKRTANNRYNRPPFQRDR